MNNLLNKFYFLSKLTTSFVLFFTLLFLGYLFLKAYVLESNNSNSVSELTKELKIISNTVENNSNNLNIIGDTIIKNNESFNKITSIVQDLKNHEPNKEFLIQINKLFKENKLLKKEIANLSIKINSLDNQNQKLVKKEEKEDLPKINLINLIKLKVENGINVLEEVKLLHNLNHNEEKETYVAKLQILSNRNFIGLNKLNKNFDKITSEYLNNYYFKNNNNFIRYLSGIVSIQPNFDGDIEDETIKLFVIVKKKLTEKDIEGALNYLLAINDSKIFFKKWINEASYFIEYEKTINKILN